jgi:hypothetical protein
LLEWVRLMPAVAMAQIRGGPFVMRALWRKLGKR